VPHYLDHPFLLPHQLCLVEDKLDLRCFLL
jgi:hypothetical protein